MRGISIVGVAVATVVAVALGVYFKDALQPGFEFSQNQRVSATAELRLAFPELMDHASTEENLSLPTEFQAQKRWDGEMLIFTPAQRLVAEKTYVFTLSRRALKADGQQLGRDLTFKFYVAGAPALSTHMPAADATDIPAESHITLIFDRPVVPLTQVQGKNATAKLDNWPVTISPQIPGKWHWLGTTTVEFIPEKSLTLATKYTVTVPVGIQTVSGDTTEKDFSWTFETQRPMVVGVDPSSGIVDAGPTSEIVLRFNQEVNLKEVQNNVKFFHVNSPSEARRDERLRKEGTGATMQSDGNQLALKPAVYGKTENEDGKMVTDKTMVVLAPVAKLDFKKEYGITVFAETLGAQGDLGTLTDFTSQFQTVGDVAVTRGTYYQGNLSIDFSNPMQGKTLKSFIDISPASQSWKDYQLGPDGIYEEDSDWSTSYVSVYPSLEPSTEYTVTVKKGAKDIYGQTLAEPYVFKFKTDAVPAEAFIKSKGEFGIFERGKPPVFYVNGVNVSTFNMQMSKLSFEQFLSIRSQLHQNYDSKPALNEGTDYQKWSIKPTAKPDHWQSIALDVQKQAGKTLGSGIFGLSMQAPEYVQTWNPSAGPVTQYQFFALTDMAITLKQSATKALVWVNNMQTGDAVGGASIAFYSLDGKQLLTGKTDAQGFLEVPFELSKFVTTSNDWNPEFWVTAAKGDDFAFVSSNWNEGYRPYSFNGVYEETRGTDGSKYRLQSYVYTERPLYRAGDSVNFKGILRMLDWDGKMHIPSQARSVLVSIQDPEGREVYNSTVKVSAYGTFTGNFTTVEDASLGQYYLSARLMPEDDLQYQSAGATFSVLAYRKPEYRVDVTPESQDYFNNSTVKGTVEGAYYFGAPMANATVNWRAQSTDYFFNKYSGDGWYSFALESDWCWYDCQRGESSLTSGDGKLDATGHMPLAFPVNIDDKGVSQVVSVDVDVTDQNNQVVSNRMSVVVHKSKLYVGIGSDDYVVTPGKTAKMRLISLDTDGKPVANQQVKLQVFLREWNTIRKKGVDGEYYYDNEAKDTLENESSITTNGEGKANADVVIPVGGGHVIVATVTDSNGRQAKASTSVYAWSSTYVNWAHDNNDRIDVLTDKPEYKVGDVAKLLVKTPFQGKGVKALITVERENVLTKTVIDVTSNAMPIEVPITADLAPNAYVSVVIVKPRVGETFNENGLDTGMPAFKIGYAALRIETKDKELHVELKTDKDRYGPREKVTVTIQTTDADGKPVPAELSLGVVDLSLLALSGFDKPDLVSIFYSQRGLGVYTSQMLSQLVERFKPGSKGGGGGVDPETVKRGDFKDTAHWLPSVVTNASGTATVTFTLPDNLTTWQLLSIGSTMQNTFGADVMTILETKKVILRPVRPRFALTDDEVKLGAIVHNFTTEEQRFKVTLTGSGFTGMGPMTQDITVAKDDQVKVMFPVKIGKGDSATFDFKAQNSVGVDEIQETIPVYKFGVPQANATSGLTEDVTTEKVLVPSIDDAEYGELSVSVSPTVATYLPAGLSYLATYPYGCAEQTASSFLPNIALSRLQGFDAFSFVDGKTLERNLSAGLQRLYGFQRSDGGFGYWEGSDRSYPYLTAYIVYALQLTKKENYTVDQTVIDQAVSYLNSELRSTASQYMDDNTRAYILFVLSEMNRSDVSLLNNLFEKRKGMAQFSKAQLAMAFQKAGQSKKAQDLITEVTNAAIVDPRGVHFEEDSAGYYGWMMHTDTLTTSTVMQALVRIQPENPMLPKMVRYLLDIRENGRWDTTQSTSITLLAFAEYLDSTKELDANFTAGVEIGGKKLLDQKFDSKNVLQRKEVKTALENLVRGKDTDVKIGKDGTGRLYYDVVLKYFYTPDSIEPAEEGIGIVREMTPITPKDASMSVGTTHKVKLTITVPEWRAFVAVESPLPAGMEAIDFSLRTTQQDLADSVNQPSSGNWSWDYYWNGLWRFRHIEFRDDRVFLFADDLPPGVYQYEYLVRATTPGKFHSRPARAWEMYYPEVFGQTSGEWMTINE